MKLGLILALSQFLSKSSPERGGFGFKDLFIPALMVGVPMLLIIKQPDLGTALSVGAIGAALILFLGVKKKVLITCALVAAIAAPVAWNLLHDYQKRRILVLIDPQADPLGSGYHIIQSKIAVGSGGLLGKGFLEGTQSQLEFLPEHTTDFIFSVLAEEFGFVGGVTVLFLYVVLLYRMLRIVSRTNDLHDGLLAFGVVGMVFFHVIINIGMVLGLFPVVGIPLPLFSYGGSSLLSTMFCMGLVMGVAMRRFAYR
jgi:rod shape determining protein RodA